RVMGRFGECRMTEAVIVGAVRTPMGRHYGALKDVRPDDLAALVVGEVVRRAGVDPALVDEVYLGCANQAGEDNRNVARMASLLAGFPVSVAGLTFNRLCSSGLGAIAAIESGGFAEEIVPVPIPQKGSESLVSRDEPPRADTSLEALSKLRPVFREGGTVTAGNSSGISDGAAAILLTSDRKADE